MMSASLPANVQRTLTGDKVRSTCDLKGHTQASARDLQQELKEDMRSTPFNTLDRCIGMTAIRTMRALPGRLIKTCRGSEVVQGAKLRNFASAPLPRSIARGSPRKSAPKSGKREPANHDVGAGRVLSLSTTALPVPCSLGVSRRASRTCTKRYSPTAASSGTASATKAVEFPEAV